MHVKLPPFVLERFFAKHELTVRRTLSSSDCEPLSMQELLALADADVLGLWENLSLAYTDTRGLAALRREIAKLHPGTTKEDVIEIVPEEGILLSMQAMVSPGDEVVVTSPGYQSLHDVARSIGAKVSPWTPDEAADGSWHFDVDKLRALVTPKTKLVVVNFPHNPTGCVPSRAEWDEVVEITRSAGARLFSDEMYRTLERERASLPSAIESYEKAIVLGGTSKTYSCPGLRVGWLVTKDRAFLDAVAQGKDWTTICGSAPSEILAVAALRSREKILERNRAIVAKSLDALDAFDTRHPGFFRWKRPDGGSTGFARVLREPASTLSERLLREKNVLLLPSTFFEFGDAHVRLGLGRADFADGLAELA